MIKVEFFFEKFGFENHLKSRTYMSYHKNNFSNDSAEKKKKFPEFFKIYVPLEFDRLSLFFDWSKCEDEKQVFDLKSQVHWIPSWFLSTSRTFLHVHFDFCPIPFDRSDFRFQKHIGIRSDFWKVFFFVYLFDISLDPFSKKKKKKKNL